MKPKKRLSVILTLLVVISLRFGFAQEEQCGAEPPKDYNTFMLKRLQAIKNSKGALSSPVSLPIQHHVSRKSDGSSPALSSSEIQNVMDELNTTYAPMNISFYEYAPTKFIDNSNWNSSFNKSSDSQLASYEVAQAINIFYFPNVTSGSNSICGFAKFPGTGNRAVLKVSCSQNGSTTSHELGHYFSVLHTHSTSNGRELVQRTNCGSTGDFFCDTPADPRLSSLVNSSCNYTGTDEDANGDQYQPDTRNVMSYTRKSCRTGGFSDQQQNAIIASLQSDRAYLTSTTNPPVCTNINNFPYTESFESGFGDWSNATSDDIEWTRDASGTPSNETGPSSAQDGSFYLYTEASTNVNPEGSPNKVAILNSPCIDLSTANNMSLEFGYHMLGTDIGTIEVLVSTDDGTSYTSLWTQNGNKGDTWNQAILSLAPHSGKVIRLQFKGTTGATWRGDMAIDNIKIKSSTNTSSCTEITSFPYNESFESGVGEWTQETNDNINWIANSASTPSYNTGPSSASNGSNYIFTEASGNGNGYPNKIALLTSPCIDLLNQSNTQLSFDYHMYGSNMGTLEVRISTDDGGNWTTIWSKNGDQGNNWNSQAINVSTYTGSIIKLQLKGTTGSSYRSDMAIDNLKITSETSDTSDIIDIETSSEAFEVSIFPNPNPTGLLFIKYPKPSKSDEIPKAIIRDITGKIVGQINLDSETTTYDISDITTGVYFITMSNSTNTISKKLIRK